MAAASISIGNWLERGVVHSQCRRISYKRKGDDAPPVGITLADIRRGKRRRTGVIGASSGVIGGVISIMGERAELALSAQGAAVAGLNGGGLRWLSGLAAASISIRKGA